MTNIEKIRAALADARDTLASAAYGMRMGDEDDVRTVGADNAQMGSERMDVAFAALEEIEREEAEDAASFDLRWNADMRAIKRWQEATGRTLTWPDHADLCVWLLDQRCRRQRAGREGGESD